MGGGPQVGVVDRVEAPPDHIYLELREEIQFPLVNNGLMVSTFLFPTPKQLAHILSWEAERAEMALSIANPQRLVTVLG